MSAHILVVEDERKLADILARSLEAAGHDVTVLYEGSAVMETVSRERIDLVLLDWLLPGVDGLTLCRQLRASSNVPIMMITAKVEHADRVAGLDTGADDYICKPFSLIEIEARIRALLRRSPSGYADTREALRIDDAAHKVLVYGKELKTTLVEYRLLIKLFSSPGHTFTRNELIDSLYDDNRVVTDRTTDFHVKNLRRKLQECGLNDVITTIYGVGYRWK
jgi:two-component system response regulator BaeR